MQKRKSIFPPFFILFALSIFIFILSRFGLLTGISGFLEKGTTPLQKFTFGILRNKNTDNIEIVKLKEQNQKLVSQLTDQEKLKRENEALKAQFETANPQPQMLLPSSIIGSEDGAIIIDKGKADGVKKGTVVVYTNNLIGQVSKLSEHKSVVGLIGSNDFTTTAKTLNTKALGIVKGGDGSIILGSVVLSDKLSKNDIVLTKGDITDRDFGIPPDLVIGRIVSINKKASSLFQSAEVESLVDTDKTDIVFLIIH